MRHNVSQSVYFLFLKILFFVFFSELLYYYVYTYKQHTTYVQRNTHPPEIDQTKINY